MTLLNIVVILIVVGVVLWLINAYVPMAAGIKALLNIVVFVVVLIWLLRAFGIDVSLPGVHMPRLM
jgi:membrane-bound ClpP family serine protease